MVSAFDAARYERLMNGLEAVEMRLSEVMKDDNPTMRLDGEFFKKHYLTYDFLIRKRKHKNLNQITEIKRGTTPKEYGSYDVSVVRSGDLNGRWLNKESLLKTKNNKDLFFLKKYDVLISSIGFGSIGKVDIFFSDEKYATVSEVTVLRNTSINAFALSEFLKSKFGQAFIEKSITGATGQLHLNTGSILDLPIPIFSEFFENEIERLVNQSYQTAFHSQKIYIQAETLLLNELGLHNWQPTNANTEIKTFKNSFLQSGRLDAEYYQPKYDEVEIAVKNNSVYYKSIAEIKTFNARGLQPDYFEDGDLPIINSKHILENTLDYNNFEKTNSRYWHTQQRAQVFENDILTYTTGANIGRTQVYLSNKKALASNHVNILRIEKENPIYVAFVMNSMLGRLQTEKLSAGSAQQELYPKDVDSFLIPFIHQTSQEKIAKIVIECLHLQEQSQRLLNIAKRAVEMAIEESEEAAMTWIEKQMV